MKKNKGTEGWQDTASSEGEVLEGARRYTQGTRQGDSTSPEACAKKKRKSATPLQNGGAKSRCHPLSGTASTGVRLMLAAAFQ